MKEGMTRLVQAQHIKNPRKSYKYSIQVVISKSKIDLALIPDYDLSSKIRLKLTPDIKSI